jgi:hypothetical protein
MSADNGSFTGPPPGPQQPHQPRWAWWIVGIVIPVVGILVTILVARPGSSDGDGGSNVESAPSTSAQPSRAGQADSAAQSSAPPAAGKEKWQRLYGPEKVKAEADITGTYFDLDTPKPLVVSSGADGADLTFGSSVNDPSMGTPESSNNLAPWPDTGTAPTAEGCQESVDRNGSYSASPLKRGDQFCLLTGEGRVAYIKVVTAPDSGGGNLDVTTWETSDA